MIDFMIDSRQSVTSMCIIEISMEIKIS